MFTFEVKPKEIIYFGDLEDLMIHKNSDCGLETTANTCLFDHNVSRGNYVVSRIDSNLNPQIILHHENVSAELIAEQLLQIEEDQRRNRNYKINKLRLSPPPSKRMRLSPKIADEKNEPSFDCRLRAQYLWPDYLKKFTLEDYRQHSIYCLGNAVRGKLCRLCHRLVTTSDDASNLQFSEWQMSLFEKIFKGKLIF